MSNIDQAAVATAKWWSKQVFGGTIASNGDPDNTSLMLAVLAGTTGVPASPSRREKFEQLLAAKVKRELERESAYSSSFTLSTDYGPEGFLATLARDMGIGGSFPWKTMTHTYPDHFVTSLGYGAGSVLTWTADDYVRPACGLGQYSDDGQDFHRLPFKCSAPKYHELNEHVFDDPDPLCQASHPHNVGKLCLRPAGDEYHNMKADYMSRWAHEFSPEGVHSA